MSMSDIFRRSQSAPDSRGFTIVELMIATLVFATILSIITAGVISFSNRYYKGVNASDTQNTAQTALDTITQAIQFGTGAVVTARLGDGFFCAGGLNFTFAKGEQYTGQPGQHGLYVSPDGGTCSGAQTTGGRQLLAKNMRITNLAVSPTGSSGLYSVELTIAYGDNDLLCNAAVPGDCTGSTLHTDADLANMPNVTCRSGAGSQFCAASRLMTTVQKRV